MTFLYFSLLFQVQNHWRYCPLTSVVTLSNAFPWLNSSSQFTKTYKLCKHSDVLTNPRLPLVHYLKLQQKYIYRKIKCWKFAGADIFKFSCVTVSYPGDLWRHCGDLGKEILMPYPLNQSWREQIELHWIGARVGLWDTALKFLSPGPRNDVTDHLDMVACVSKRNILFPIKIMRLPSFMLFSKSLCTSVL